MQHDKRPSKRKGWRRQFRSNLSKLVAFFTNVTLQSYHIDLLKTTPFYHFLIPFVDKAVNPTCIKGTTHGVVKIINTYNKQQKTFVLGGKQLMITPTECDVILGITSGNKDIDLKDCLVGPASLRKRKFPNISEVKPKHLKTQLMQSIESSELVDIQDTIRLIILYVMSSILFVASSEVARWWMFRVCENLDELHEYNWGKAIVDYLMKYVDTKDPQDVKGCTTLLQVPTPKSTYSV